MNKSVLVDEYISQFPEHVQGRLLKIREIIITKAPGVIETIKYRMPTYEIGKNLVHFAAYENHVGFYPTPSGIEAFKNELTEFKFSKGAVQFPHTMPVPYDLISKIVQFRVKELEDRKK